MLLPALALTATRSALLTGRHPIRTGAVQSVPAGLPQGITPYEITLAQLLSAQGYATAIYGKWHLGDRPGRFPTDRGFDEWYGVPRTTNESMFTQSPGYDPDIVPLPQVLQSRKGELPQTAGVYDIEMRRRIDGDLIAKAQDFITRQSREKKPFFCYVPITQLHYPTIPHHDFAGKTGAGDFADALAEMDHRVGQLLDTVDSLNIGGNTLFLFVSDNGPEFRRPWRGTAGPWRGTYHTSMEGALRAPCMLRWPGRVPAGKVSNEIVHVTDLYVTLAAVAGATVPDDRPIDGVDQRDFLFGRSEKSAREGFVYYIKTELRAAKWRDWKMHLVWEPEPNIGPNHLETPWIFNLIRDPKEETDVGTEFSWVRRPLRLLIEEFGNSLKKSPPIPPGAPDDYRPAGR